MCFAKSDAVPSMILQIDVVQIDCGPPSFSAFCLRKTCQTCGIIKEDK